MSLLYKIDNLKQEYLHKSVLDISSFEIFKNEIVGVVGSNGSGKSTLLRHLAFLEEAKSGEVTYKNYTNPPLNIKREISILLPEPYLLKRSVKENLIYGLKVRGDSVDIDKRVKDVMDLVGLLPSKFLHRQWFELSSGETQRLALASRLILKPEVLLLDEPTNSLDVSGIPLFTNAIKYANENWGTTLVIATHDLVWLSSLASRKITLHFGKIIDYSTTNLLLGRWSSVDNRLVFTFSDNQKIALSKNMNIGEKRGVAISPRDIKISTTRSFSGGITLSAKVKDISFLEKDSKFSIKVVVGTHTFESIQDSATFLNDKLYPTQSVFINIQEEDIKKI